MDINFANPQLIKDLDVLSELFTQEVLNEIGKHIDYFIKKWIYSLIPDNLEKGKTYDLEIKPIEPENLEEKLFVILKEASLMQQQYEEPLRLAKEIIAKIDLKEFFLEAAVSKLDFQTKDAQVFSDLLENKEYLNQLISVLDYNEDEKNQFIKTISSKQETKKFLSDNKDNEFLIKLLLTFQSAAYLKKQLDAIESSTPYPPLLLARISQNIIGEFSNEYNLWEQCFRNPEQIPVYQALLFKEFSDAKNSTQKYDLSTKGIVLSTFLHYYSIYSKNALKFQFEYYLKTLVSSPIKTLRFTTFIKEHRFCIDFIDTYSDYCKNNNITPLFDINSVNKEIRKIVIDEDITHKNWFEKLPYNIDIHTLERKLSIIYRNLVDKGFLSEDTLEKVFIYRFSGIKPSYPLADNTFDNAKYYLGWKKDVGALAYFVDRLYNSKKYGSPQFKKIGSFFYPSYSNGAGQKNYKGTSKDDLEEIIKESFR